MRYQRTGDDWARRPLGYSGQRGRIGTGDWSRRPPQERWGRKINQRSKPRAYYYPQGAGEGARETVGPLDLVTLTGAAYNESESVYVSDVLFFEVDPHEGLTGYFLPFIGCISLPQSTNNVELGVWPVYYDPTSETYLQQTPEKSTNEQMMKTLSDMSVPNIYLNNPIDDDDIGSTSTMTFPQADDWQPVSEHCMMGSVFAPSLFVPTLVGWGVAWRISFDYTATAIVDAASVSWTYISGLSSHYIIMTMKNANYWSPQGLVSYISRYPNPPDS